ncbi:MAG: hypothetical protein ABSG11_22775, partial [Candidatus Korobacteraceae bacterium]
MNKLEDLRPNATVKGILRDCFVTVVNIQWYGSTAVELTYKSPDGKVANELLYRHDEPRIEVVEHGRPWSFDGDGAKFRLVSEAHRILCLVTILSGREINNFAGQSAKSVCYNLVAMFDLFRLWLGAVLRGLRTRRS